MIHAPEREPVTENAAVIQAAIDNLLARAEKLHEAGKHGAAEICEGAAERLKKGMES